MFSTGSSSSAAATHYFPALVTMANNVHAQHRLLDRALRRDRHRRGVRLLDGRGPGRPLGRLLTRTWSSVLIVVCGGAWYLRCITGCSWSGPLRTLEAGARERGEDPLQAPSRMLCSKAFGHIYAGSGLSQDFYRVRTVRDGARPAGPGQSSWSTWEEVRSPRAGAGWNPDAQALTWQEADISANERYGGDLAVARGPDQRAGAAHAECDRPGPRFGPERRRNWRPAPRGGVGCDRERLGAPGWEARRRSRPTASSWSCPWVWAWAGPGWCLTGGLSRAAAALGPPGQALASGCSPILTGHQVLQGLPAHAHARRPPAHRITGGRSAPL